MSLGLDLARDVVRLGAGLSGTLGSACQRCVCGPLTSVTRSEKTTSATFRDLMM